MPSRAFSLYPSDVEAGALRGIRKERIICWCQLEANVLALAWRDGLAQYRRHRWAGDDCALPHRLDAVVHAQRAALPQRRRAKRDEFFRGFGDGLQCSV